MSKKMNAEAKKRHEKSVRARGADALQLARKLERRERIRHASHHHKGMAELKSQRGSPRPEGMTLSLINPCSLNCYWGRDYSRGSSKQTRLSVNPDDYTWESIQDNGRRSKNQMLLMFSEGFIDINGDPISVKVHPNQLKLF